MSAAASHPYAQCLWKNDLKSFLQEQDTRKYSFPHIGALRETIHEQIKTIILKHMYLGTSLVIDTVDKSLLANAEDITNSTFENKR